jgi:hypothetical protein
LFSANPGGIGFALVKYGSAFNRVNIPQGRDAGKKKNASLRNKVPIFVAFSTFAQFEEYIFKKIFEGSVWL